MKKQFEVIEDNGGGLYLVVFNDNGNVIYLHSGYEYTAGALKTDISALDTEDPEDWEGNEENPQQSYDDMTDYEYGWEVIADNNGCYYDKMGCAGHREFGNPTAIEE